MPVVVVFLIFIVCLVIAIPVSIALGIVAVLPGAGTDVCSFGNPDGKGRDFQKVI